MQVFDSTVWPDIRSKFGRMGAQRVRRNNHVVRGSITARMCAFDSLGRLACSTDVLALERQNWPDLAARTAVAQRPFSVSGTSQGCAEPI
jgi:hypothetical protein